MTALAENNTGILSNMNNTATNGTDMVAIEKPYLELYVKASGIDQRRIGACLFCQEFWMELYALYELGLVRVEVKTVNVNSEPFKRNFLGASPPIMVETNRLAQFLCHKIPSILCSQLTYTDNRELEGRIFHIAKEFRVPLFEKDVAVEKRIETLFRNFKLFIRASVDARKPGASRTDQLSAQSTKNKLIEQLAQIDQLLRDRGTRYLLGTSMTEYDCELMPRLHHIRVAGGNLSEFELPVELVHLWNYLLTAYRTAAFIESCPADQDIIYHYKEQLNMTHTNREALQEPTKTHTIPDDVLGEIKRLQLN